MNERMRDIALQSADKIADLFSPEFFDDQMINDVAAINEKLVELVVRECVRTVARQELMSHPEYEWKDKESGYNEGIQVAMKKIKQHFGVE